METATPLEGRVALVTGASRGIGFATARLLAARGAHVVAVARTTGGLEELDDAIREDGFGGATLVPLDLTDEDAIQRLGVAVAERWGRLDCLVSNAAIFGTMTPVSHLRPSQWNKVIAVNLTANFNLIQALEPLLLASKQGRAIFVTALGAQESKPFVAAYGASKAGLDSLVRSWAEEHRNTPLRVNLLDPGPSRTRMRAQVFPGEDSNSVPDTSVAGNAILDRIVSGDPMTGGVWSTMQGRWLEQ